MSPSVDPRAELAHVGLRTRSPVREQTLFHPFAEEPFDQECRFSRDGHAITWRANGRLFMIDVMAASGIVFAAGRPDQIVGASQPAGSAAGVAIFVNSAFLPTSWLSELEHAILVAALGVGRNEHLLVARNKTSLMVEPRGIEADWKRLDDLLLLVTALPPDDPPPPNGELIDGLHFDAPDVAPEFQQLLPMLRTWATGDDTDRSDRIAAASNDALRELVTTVGGELHRIDALIDSPGERLSDEAALLGRLAEATLEAQHELARRS
jgi:hypothetical protein